MNKISEILRWVTGGSMLGAAILLGLNGFTASAMADGPRVSYGADKALATEYKESCGDCHFAYPPQLLPKASWQEIMLNLDQHYDENAELEADEVSRLMKYLMDNTSSSSRRYRNAARDAVPMRITKLNYFTHEHDEIPDRMSVNNPEVGSFSNCDACHQTNSWRMFDDDNIRIPGFGRWDDD